MGSEITGRVGEGPAEQSGRSANGAAEENGDENAKAEKREDATGGESPGTAGERAGDSRSPGAEAGKPATPPVKKSPAKPPASKQVERVTALRGPDGEIPRPSRASLRRRTLNDLQQKDPDIPYKDYEAASRDLVCSLMERQDRITEGLLRRILALEYEVRDLQEEVSRRWK